MTTNLSALVVLVPDAEVLAKPCRDKHDPAAALGMPAHVTLLYPFIPPNKISLAIRDDLKKCFSLFTPFQFSLTEVRQFPGVVYLSPEPDEPFRQLTLAIWKRYSEHPPYEGRHPDIVPHLCLAQLRDESHLDAIAEEFMRTSGGRLPIQAIAEKIALVEFRSERWHINTLFGLADVE